MQYRNKEELHACLWFFHIRITSPLTFRLSNKRKTPTPTHITRGHTIWQDLHMQVLWGIRISQLGNGYEGYQSPKGHLCSDPRFTWTCMVELPWWYARGHLLATWSSDWYSLHHFSCDHSIPKKGWVYMLKSDLAQSRSSLVVIDCLKFWSYTTYNGHLNLWTFWAIWRRYMSKFWKRVGKNSCNVYRKALYPCWKIWD